MYKRILFITITALALTLSAQAAKYQVSSAAEVAALKNLKGADTVVMHSGTYTSESITIKGSGTKDAPLVFMGEKPGTVILTGNSKIAFGGDYVVVRDLWFKDVELDKGSAVISFKASTNATNSTVTECAITGTGLKQSMTDYKWVSLYGTNNTVSRCSFIDKRNMGTLLVVWFEKDVTPTHTIIANYFSRPMKILNDQAKAINGQETLRIGTSDFSMQSSKCLVKDNYFYRCNGETEIVSNKSCENRYVNNLFMECDGCLTLRHGNGCKVDGNYFFGNNVPNTGGVRIIGEDHKVYNNYFQSLAGKGYTSAICVVQGIKDTPLNGYYKAKNVDIAFNTLVNCYAGISVNYGSARQDEAVEDITIANNVIYNTVNPKSVAILYVDAYSPKNIRWSNNICFTGKISGISPDEASVITIDPAMVERKGAMRPVAKSPLKKYLTKGFDYIVQDIADEPREADSKVPGAFNLGSNNELDIPTKELSGVTWKLTL